MVHCVQSRIVGNVCLDTGVHYHVKSGEKMNRNIKIHGSYSYFGFKLVSEIIGPTPGL